MLVILEVAGRRADLSKNWLGTRQSTLVCHGRMCRNGQLGRICRRDHQHESAAGFIGAIMAAGAAGFMANYFAFCQEVSTKHTGLIVGILGGLGNLFAGGFLPYAGMVKDVYGSFGPIFVVVGMIPLIGLAVLGLGWGLNLKPSTDQ